MLIESFQYLSSFIIILQIKFIQWPFEQHIEAYIIALRGLILIIIFMDHYKEIFSDTPPPFGKYQRAIAIVAFIGIQSALYFFTILSIYAVVTLKIKLILFLGTISLLQRYARRSPQFINCITHYLQVRRYSKGVKIIYEQAIEQDKKCLFGMHPHGVLSSVVLGSMNLKKGPLSKVVGLSSRFALSCPVVGLFLRLWGVESVDHNHMKSLLYEGKNIILVPGGFEEATLTTPKQLRIYINKRKGFIKYAMEHNYSIYPILQLNQHKAFWTFDYFINFRLFLNKIKLPGVLYWNMKSLFFLPTDLQYFTVVGKKINYRQLKGGEMHTKGEIEQAHFKYIEQIKRIHQKYRHLSGDVPLKIY